MNVCSAADTRDGLYSLEVVDQGASDECGGSSDEARFGCWEWRSALRAAGAAVSGAGVIAQAVHCDGQQVEALLNLCTWSSPT